jgi:YVTN family beta-propeller protein
MTVLNILTIAVLLGGPVESASTAPALDFSFFQERVEPIFVQKRPGHARCVTCHQHGSPPLEPISPGAVTWNEEQSRKNFAIWKQFVVPGKPMKSALLLHPLAEAAGGDRFHAGGKHWKSQSDPEWQVLAAWVRGEHVTPHSAGVVRVLQTNSAGDNVHVIDPATNQVVALIENVEVPHGIAIAPDGSRIYITNESRRTLDVADAKTLEIFKRIPLSGRPNNLDVAKDGAHVYVGIAQAPGAVDVIDATSLTNLKSIPVQGAIHNVYVTPDGKYAVAGSIPGKTINVIDTSSNAVAWTLTLSDGIRPMVFTRNPDGSTKEIIVQLSGFHGFAVVDFASRKETRRIALPDPPGEERETQGLQGSPSHGLALTPDGKILWVASKYYGFVAAYSVPDYKLQKIVRVGSHPEWLTIPPDGRSLYVAVAGEDRTAVVDNSTMTVVKMIPVGAVPKRNASGILRTE